MYNLLSDEGKLSLAAKDIYGYDQKDIKKRTLEEKYNATMFDKGSTNTITGFSGYALQDNNTGEIVIVFVGTQAEKDIGDIGADAAIGLNNLTGNYVSTAQVDEADAYYQMVKAEAHGAKISLTGHSLGGGLADSVAMRNPSDNLDVLSLNPAPLLSVDVVKYGYGFDKKNIRNVINENDPLHQGVKSADMVIPGQMFIIPNGKGHSYKFENSDFDKYGNLKWFDKLKSNNDTGLDWFPGFYELVSSAGDIYKGIAEKKMSKGTALKISAVSSVSGISNLVFVMLTFGDFNALKTKLLSQNEGFKATILMNELVVNLIKMEGINAIGYIENSFANMKERVNATLDNAFHIAFQGFKLGVAFYLTRSEIKSIFKEIGLSYLHEFKDMLKGDFYINPHIEQIVISHLISRYQTYKTLFLQDPHKGINKNLVNEISSDIKNLSNDIALLESDVTSAVVSMMEKDEELKNTLFNHLVS